MKGRRACFQAPFQDFFRYSTQTFFGQGLTGRNFLSSNFWHARTHAHARTHTHTHAHITHAGDLRSSKLSYYIRLLKANLPRSLFAPWYYRVHGSSRRAGWARAERTMFVYLHHLIPTYPNFPPCAFSTFCEGFRRLSNSTIVVPARYLY